MAEITTLGEYYYARKIVEDAEQVEREHYGRFMRELKNETEVKRAMQPMITFRMGIAEEVTAFEKRYDDILSSERRLLFDDVLSAIANAGHSRCRTCWNEAVTMVFNEVETRIGKKAFEQALAWEE